MRLNGIVSEFVRELVSLKCRDLLAIYLYGSAARGDFSSRHSDIDFYVLCKNVTKAFERRVDMIALGLGKTYGIRVEPTVVPLNHIGKESQSFHRKVFVEGKCLYSQGLWCIDGKTFGLKPSILYSYSLKNLPFRTKARICRTLHGYVYKYKNKQKSVPGLFKSCNTIAPTVFLAQATSEKEFDEFFKFNNVDFKKQYVWSANF